MKVLFENGSDVAIIDGQSSAITGFKDVCDAAVKSVEFDFVTRQGVIKWNPVEIEEIIDVPVMETFKMHVVNDGMPTEEIVDKEIQVGTEKVARKTGVLQTPNDTPIVYDHFYAYASRDLSAWYRLMDGVNKHLDDRRHAAESEAAMDEAERENAAFDSAGSAVQPEPPAEVKVDPAHDDSLERVIAAHRAQAERTLERSKNAKESNGGGGKA